MLTEKIVKVVDRIRFKTDNNSLKIFKPTFYSIIPHFSLYLYFPIMALTCWAIYFFVATRWYIFILAFLSSILALWKILVFISVATTHVIMDDIGLEIKGLLRKNMKICWRDIEKIQVFEKFRGYLPPMRTDRLILFNLKDIGIVAAVNPDIWPEEDEKLFLKILEDKALEYEFKIYVATTKW